jgi:hypothetical protein
MQQINLHQRKLYAIIEAALALIALLLPWTNYKITQAFNFFGGGGGGSIPSDNGFRSWGYLVLLGIVGVIICSLMGDKTKDYDGNMKLATMASFGAIALGSIIYMIRLNSVGPLQDNGGNPVTVSAGFGLWTALIAGVIGLAWVSGVLDQVMKKPTAPVAK